MGSAIVRARMGARREREMVYKSSLEAGYGMGVSTDYVDASHADRIDIPDAALLFRGHFAHAGPDLILTGEDGHRLVITGYFANDKHPDLVAPNGAHVTGDLVDLLTGSPAPGQYAQAKTTLPPEAIGKVEKVVGQVTLIHNGVAGPLHVGDPVCKTDIVETAANSSCGIAFPDGTALDLVNNTRMALSEYNYETNSASNGAIFSLVEGTFAFVAGQVAHTGEGLKINTPVATMGIRGTVGLFRTEPTVINSNLGRVWSVFLHEDIDGSHHLGRIALIDQDPTSPTFGQTFYLLDSSDYIAYLEPQAAGQPPHVRLEPISSSKVLGDRHFFDDLSQILTAFQNGQDNPQSIPGIPGSGDDPNQLIPTPRPHENGGDPRFIDFVPLQGSSGDLFAQPPFSGFNSPVMPGQSLNNTPETDIITANASDSLGNKAIPAAINVTVNPTAPMVTSTTVSGVEQQAIALHLASLIATNGQAGSFLNAVTLTFTVPTGDIYTFASTNDPTVDASFTAGAHTLTLTAAQIAVGALNDLSITTGNDSSVSLLISATQQDSKGNTSVAATGTETVTVSPTAPSVSPQPVSGVEGQAITLNLGISPTGEPGNVLDSVTLTFTVPTGDSYTFTSTSDLNQTFTAGPNQTLTLTPAQLAGLSITTTSDSNVSLSVSAI